jgi:hypothetical protein
MSLMDLIVKGCKYVDEACAEIRRRYAFRAVDAGQRRKVQGQWLKNGIEIARRAAHCLDLYARYLPGVPYTGDEIREKAARVATTREVWVQLDLLARQARDTYLIERSELHAMSMGVRKALEATASYPFLPEGDRQNIQAGIATLRAELDEKNRKISKTKKAAGKRKAEARAAAERVLDEAGLLPRANGPSPGPARPIGGLRRPGAMEAPQQACYRARHGHRRLPPRHRRPPASAVQARAGHDGPLLPGGAARPRGARPPGGL